jgi:hypothetical protein
LQQLLQSAPPADLKILLVHQPSQMVLSTAREYGYDLFLAGHTHGGQIILKPFGFTLTPTQVENEFFSGWDRINGMNVLISDGIGMSLVPVRYRARGTINQFSLVHE